MVYLSLDKKFVDENLKNWNDNSISEMGEDGKNSYLYTDNIEAKIEEIDEGLNKIHIICDNPKLGYISSEISIDTDDMINLFEIAVKRLNKFKTVLQGLK